MLARLRTPQEKAEFVAEYLVVEHGQKLAWLAERGIDSRTMSRWRKAFFFGDLDAELIPRDTSLMDVAGGAKFKQLEVQLAAEKAAREADRREHAAEIERLQEVNDALGKAIGLLHDRAGEQQEPKDES
ncbi:hypothetical protein ACPYO6_15105 [Georgenia sp. Z1344]|uniref:hypothetical protein n=1 Tax=Georgenia sp. Z1344 TaxID=3416706 RepID=UPI003CF181DF